jgi:hypothetical protein
MPQPGEPAVVIFKAERRPSAAEHILMLALVVSTCLVTVNLRPPLRNMAAAAEPQPGGPVPPGTPVAAQ